MPGYRRNRFLTTWDIVANIENWWAGWDLRLRRQYRRPELLRLRNGLRVVCRGGTRDWDVLQEVFFVGAYGHAMRYLGRQAGAVRVLDLGANIGFFSLLAASTHPDCLVRAYEPGPPNFTGFEINSLLNPRVSARIELVREAAGGSTRKADWHFDELNPAGSSLFAASGRLFPVAIRAFPEILESIDGMISLAKIDIEGAEYELIESIEEKHWLKLQAVVIEIHDDPRGKSRPGELLEHFRRRGYTCEPEIAGCYFLERKES